MAHGEISVVLNNGIVLSHGIDPWLIIGLAASYQQMIADYDAAGMDEMATQCDQMLLAMQHLAGMALFDDKDYFTFGPGNEEYLRNCGDEG